MEFLSESFKANTYKARRPVGSWRDSRRANRRWALPARAQGLWVELPRLPEKTTPVLNMPCQPPRPSDYTEA